MGVVEGRHADHAELEPHVAIVFALRGTHAEGVGVEEGLLEHVLVARHVAVGQHPEEVLGLRAVEDMLQHTPNDEREETWAHTKGQQRERGGTGAVSLKQVSQEEPE